MNSPFLLAIAVLAALILSPALADISPAEKAAKLATLRAAYKAEVAKSGADSDPAKAIQAQIAELEKQKTSDAPATAPTAAEPEKPAEKPDVHEIPELVAPSSYVRRDGVNNPCGPYAIAAVLGSFGDKADFSEIYDAITPAGGTIGAGTHEMISYLHKRGHGATERNNGSIDDLASAIDRGERLICTVNTKDPPEIRGSHWVAVKGYKIVNGKRYWTLVDAAWGEGGDFGPGGKYHPDGMPEEEFRKRWADPIGGALGTGAGMHNYYITVDKDPPGILDRALNAFYGLNSLTSSSVLASGLRDVTRGWGDLTGGGRTVGQRVGGFFDIVGGGVFKLGLNAVPLLANAAGHALRDAGSALRGWAADKWQNGNIFEKAGAVGATLLSAICTGAGWVLNGASAIVSGILGFAGDVIGGVGDVVGGIIDGIGSLF